MQYAGLFSFVTALQTGARLWRDVLVRKPEKPCKYCEFATFHYSLIGYDVISGADGSWTKGSDKAYTITVKRSEDDACCFAHYVETLIDGKTVVVSAKTGSTVVTISAGTLEKLSAGTHTVTVKFDDVQTTAILTVKNRTASTDSEPSKLFFRNGILLIIGKCT